MYTDVGIYTIHIHMYLWQSPGNAARRKLLTELHQQAGEGTSYKVYKT